MQCLSYNDGLMCSRINNNTDDRDDNDDRDDREERAYRAESDDRYDLDD